MGTLRVDENEINYGFVNNMDGAKSNIEYANTKINWLFDNYCVPTDFAYYNSLVRMKSDLEDEVTKIEKFKQDILDFVAYLKEIEAENSNLMNSSTVASLLLDFNNNKQSNSKENKKSNLKEYSFADYEEYMQYLKNSRNVDAVGVDFYVGSKVAMKNGTKYTANSLGEGNFGIIGQTDGRQEGDYYVDRVALYHNGKLVANIGEEGTNIDAEIKKYAKEQGCSESEIKTVMHISTGAEHEEATGWVDVSQMTYNDFKQNRTEYYQNVNNESGTTSNIQTREIANRVAKETISGATTAASNLATKRGAYIIATNALAGINSAVSESSSQNGRIFERKKI